MSWFTSCAKLVRKYGKAAKVVVSGVLNVVAPGSGTLLHLANEVLDQTGEVLDAAQDISENSQRERWEAEMLARIGQSEAEMQRLGQLLECLLGPLAVLCDKAAAFADQAEDLPDIIARALAANPALSEALHGIEGIKIQFNAFHADLRRVAQNQADAIPVYERMNRVADYFDELWAAGIKPRDFAHYVHSHREVVAKIEQGKTADLDNVLLDMRTATPKAASVCVLEAAAATRDGDYPAAQRALTTAVRLRPQDANLAELSRRVTVLATQATPKKGPGKTDSTAPEPARLQPGDTVDGWLLETRLGAGGWGQVFNASRDGQARALKVMHPNYATDRAFVERFKKEIESLMRLPRHGNLVRYESFGYCTTRHTWCLVMEYLDGPTLESFLTSRGPLTEGQVRRVFPDLVEGLARAHTAGIVHRDIKPGNLIFRKSDQRLVLVDFGLAVGVEDFGRTKVGGISIQFAAPEQHFGDPATQASDVFSLCAVIHYALNHDKPEQRKPHCFTPSLAPESLREVLVAGLRSNARERLQNAGQLLAALIPTATVAQPQTPVGPTADPVTEYAQWKRQIEELKAQAVRAADVFDYARAVTILETVPSKHRDNDRLADWTGKRDRLRELLGQVESGWRDMSEDELAGHLEEILGLHPDHPRAKPWLAQFGTQAERLKKKLTRGKIGDTIGNELGMKFAWVPPGKNWLGGGDGKPGTKEFTLAKGLWCGVYPVTQAEWQAIVGNNPANFGGNPQYPVENVSWNDVQEFLKKLNARLPKSGLLYRLPSEEEWEYICRGGPASSQTQSSFHFYFARSKTDLTPVPTNNLSSTQANFDGNHPVGSAAKGPYLERPCDVGLYLPNPLGIYDLHGNVWEWTSSQEGSGRVYRGGSWYFDGADCAAARRLRNVPAERDRDLGFRLLAVPSV